LYRTERDKGTLYELFFAKEDSSSFRHVTLFRPFGPIMKVRSTSVETLGMIINIIVPLAGRVETFSQFLQNFRAAAFTDTNIFFLHREETFSNYTLIPVDEEFSRGRGLDIGAHAWNRGDVLMFFCDVDIRFSLDFLNTCRLHAAPSRFLPTWLRSFSSNSNPVEFNAFFPHAFADKKVFYPVVFSLYNPAIVYGSLELAPPIELQLVKHLKFRVI
ncbi:hypothetical protein GOODEAATRI_013379, partial [Goodea atripinnis]